VVGLGAIIGCGNVQEPQLPSVATIVVSPPSVVIVVGTSVQFKAELRDSAGNVLVGRRVIWSSDDTLAVQVSDSGVATGVGLGIANITASSGGASGSAEAFVQYICRCASGRSAGAASSAACACGS
jgi:hypothetical protein